MSWLILAVFSAAASVLFGIKFLDMGKEVTPVRRGGWPLSSDGGREWTTVKVVPEDE